LNRPPSNPGKAGQYSKVDLFLLPNFTAAMTTILVIEDHNDVRENIVEILELANYNCLQASNGKEGVRVALDSSPDLIICDIMMPELDGYGVLHILNKREDTRHIPFIFLSAKSEKTDFRKGMSMGADDYLTKPFDDKELLQAVELRLSKKSSPAPVNQKFEENGSSIAFEKKLQDALKELFESSEERQFRKKEIIFSEGERTHYLYMVKTGSVKLYKTNDIGKEVILKLVGPNEFFGYLSILNEGVFSESASALENTYVKIIPKAEFLKSLFEKKELASFMIKLLADQVNEAEDRLMKMAYNSVRKKVAEALLFVYKQRVSHQKNDTLINILRDDLAGIAGTAKETAIRTLADFREEKLIDISDRTIKLLDIKGLENLPN